MALTKIEVSMYEDISGANNLVKLDANAKIPAGPAANLTNLPGPVQSTSDPTISSNKALGTQWINKTSGEVYVCTNATADANVWTNVGEGTGDIQPFAFQGTVSGYTFGSNVLNDSEIVDKFSLTSDGNATNVATLSVKRLDPAEACSSTHGYAAGGWDGGAHSNIIDKWTFASDNDATDVGDLTAARYYACGQSSSTHGYMTGGSGTTSGSRNDIDKWSTSSDANATVVGTLTVARHFTSGQSSATHGYISSGNQDGGSNYRNIIDKFTFASDANATDVGDLVSAKDQTAGQSSTTHGYVSGGYNNSGNFNTIEKFAFASDGNASDIADLSDGVRYNFSGSSSTTHGYSNGGQLSNAGTTVNIIDKFPFSSNANATDVGDLSTNKCQTGSTQN